MKILRDFGHQGVTADFFKVGPMKNGWDDVAWAAKGWPTSGELEVTLEVTKVFHS
jgi:hypothetical protein